MTRCRVCEGLIGKKEKVCFTCGDRVAGRSQPISVGKCIAVVLTLVVIASAGLTALLLHFE